MICTNKFRLLTITKDGGPESRVWAYWLIGIKAWFSIVLLRFDNGYRDAYYDHAFNSVSWVLWGRLHEFEVPDPEKLLHQVVKEHRPSLTPVITRRSTLHKVVSRGRTWVLSFRGPWCKEWHERIPCPVPWPECSPGDCSRCGGKGFTLKTLTHGRVEK